MARTAKEIQEQIDKLEAARKVTRARNGYAHYSERISYLQGELMLQKAKEQRAIEIFTEYHRDMAALRSLEEFLDK